MATEAEQRVIDAARTVVRATLAHVRERAAFDAGQTNPDFRWRLALAEAFHSTALDNLRAESALIDAVDALDATVPA